MNRFWPTLAMAPGLGNKKIATLYRFNPSMEHQDFTNTAVGKIIKNASLIERLLQPDYWSALRDKAEALILQHEKAGIQVLSIADEQYPALLRTIEDPPALLYGKGQMDTLGLWKSVAIIGTRHPTAKGLLIARKIAEQFARRGFVIISGLAEGIDGANHQGALIANGRTIAVMAGSLDTIYPEKHRSLANEILQSGGALVSEMPLGSVMHRGNFVQRDRIQSGLSLGICVIQTDTDGGSMHTVRSAMAQHRAAFCPQITEDPTLPVYRGIEKILQEYQADILKDRMDYPRLEAKMIDVAKTLLLKGNRLASDTLIDVEQIDLL